MPQRLTASLIQRQAAMNSVRSILMHGCFSTDNKYRVRLNIVARILSIDYGKKRTGLAVTDPLQIIAGGLATVPTSALYDYLCDYVSHEPVERIVIGRPVQPNGEPSENMARVQQFVNRWRKAMSGIPIEYYDERFTSVLAHRAMIDGGLRRKARRDKALVDEISATIILQDYMRGHPRV